MQIGARGGCAIAVAAAVAVLSAKASAAPLTVLYHADLDGRFAAPACGKNTAAPPPADFAALVGRISAKLSIPLLPTLFVTAGLGVYGVERQRQGFAAAYDTTIGLRVHLDAAYQRL